MKEILQTALEAADKAEKIAKEIRASGHLGLDFKGDVNLCTLADTKAEAVILETILKKFPSHSILSEETNFEIGNQDFEGPLWVIDPIDGTTNFAHGLPHVGISIGFYDQGKAQAAVVRAPFYNETFTAIRGEGARMNGMPVKPSEAQNIKSALVCTGFPYQRSDLDAIKNRLAAMLEACRDVRRLGAASLDICWVACGRLDVYYEDVSPWDMAAGQLIAREAGAVIAHFRENSEKQLLPAELRSDSFVVANKQVMASALEILRRFQ